MARTARYRQRLFCISTACFMARRITVARDLASPVMRLSANNLIGACLSAAILAACGAGNNGLSSSTPVSVKSRMARQLPATSAEQVVYRFAGGTDGANPESVLVNVNGTLYGTTIFGGTGSCSGSSGASGCGTVFKVSTSGDESVLYRFKGGADGANPEMATGLIATNDALYGTTANGGGSGCYDGGGCGTVFKLNLSGKETVLYRFKGTTDGAYPLTGVLARSGALYGVAYGGGGGSGCGSSAGCGTVFKLSASGKERALYSFKGGTDGANPLSLIDVNGVFYGTTTGGGGTGCGGGGCGTAYKVSGSTGAESVLHSFQGGSDGADPQSSLLEMNGAFFGTTYLGGGSECGGSGCGTVFELSASDSEGVLWHFRNGPDPAKPGAGLIAVNGRMYGISNYGGFHGGHCDLSGGCGTVFQVFLAKSGYTGSTIYAFKGHSLDGAFPHANLLNVNGTIYGTTYQGDDYGCGGKGCGTVFRITL